MIRSISGGGTPIQLPFNHFGIQYFHFNDNYLGTGTLSIGISENGLINASGTATFYIDNITLYNKVQQLENLFTSEAYKRLDNSTTITLKSSFNIAIITFNEGASNIARSLTLVLKKGIMKEFNCISGSSLQGYLKFSYDGDRTISGFRNITSESLSKDVLVVYF